MMIEFLLGHSWGYRLLLSTLAIYWIGQTPTCGRSNHQSQLRTGGAVRRSESHDVDKHTQAMLPPKSPLAPASNPIGGLAKISWPMCFGVLIQPTKRIRATRPGTLLVSSKASSPMSVSQAGCNCRFTRSFFCVLEQDSNGRRMNY